jgi:hypothetical protein
MIAPQRSFVAKFVILKSETADGKLLNILSPQ